MEMAVFKSIKVLSIILFLIPFGLISQEDLPPLERPVTLNLTGSTIKNVLKEMEIQGAYNFAYRTDIIATNTSQITRNYINKSTREVLDDLFQGTIIYREKGNYIILRSPKKAESSKIHLEGYITDIKTGEKIPYATIYDSTSFTSSISDIYGHYSLDLNNREPVLLSIKKHGYRDTTLLQSTKGNTICNIQLESLVLTNEIKPKEKALWFERFLPTEEQKENLRNFRDKLKRKTQVSFLPYIGTNRKLSGNTNVDYSLNILGGINGGVRKVEIGGIFNLVLDSMRYFQAAGVFNVVGGHQQGAQFAGVTNINNSSFTGGQFSGFSNITRGLVTGVQGAGFSNYATKVKGAQLAGFMNVSNENIHGAQVAGFLNIAKKVNGVQVGFINICDSIQGVPVGFFSYVRNGYHQLEISANEITQANIAFKTGTKHFYNSFLGGVRFDGDKSIFSYGYGIGSSVRASDKARVFFDLQVNSFMQRSTTPLNMLNKLTISYHWQIAPKLALAAGPSFNVFVVESTGANAESSITQLAPYNFSSINQNAFAVKMWVGGHIALRLF